MDGVGEDDKPSRRNLMFITLFYSAPSIYCPSNRLTHSIANSVRLGVRIIAILLSHSPSTVLVAISGKDELGLSICMQDFPSSDIIVASNGLKSDFLVADDERTLFK